ncbi:MAG: hypothetical protein SVR94_15705, partial [Pseudomonadota bacterium]|nr:hypothetical protein [Pseudomonadota bacterium]
VQLGQKAVGIQKYVPVGGSTSKQMLVFDICLDTINAARGLKQLDEQALIYAVAGELEMELTRKGDAAAREHRGEQKLVAACLEVAELFVQEVWFKVLGGHAPSQKDRRVLGSIYRMAFLLTHEQAAKTKKATETVKD